MHHLAEAQDQVQRCAQLVADVGGELFLELPGVFRLLIRVAQLDLRPAQRGVGPLQRLQRHQDFRAVFARLFEQGAGMLLAEHGPVQRDVQRLHRHPRQYTGEERESDEAEQRIIPFAAEGQDHDGDDEQRHAGYCAAGQQDDAGHDGRQPQEDPPRLVVEQQHAAQPRRNRPDEQVARQPLVPVAHFVDCCFGSHQRQRRQKRGAVEHALEDDHPADRGAADDDQQRQTAGDLPQ